MGQNVPKRNVPDGTKWRKMRMPNWTEEQKQAIYEKDSNLLVAAAAGSRKNSSISRKNNK